MWLTVARMSQNWETTPKIVTAVSIKALPSVCREGLPLPGNSVYCVQVPRTDENGRQLKALLDYLLDGEIDAKDLFDALGVSSSTYYRRIKESDYPNAEELRRVADRFALSYPDLQIQFGLMSRQEVWNYVRAAESAHSAAATLQDTTTKSAVRQRSKLSELTPRLDAPPL
ncbi:Uncharacterised protein [Mycolicibacterium vanbaalenii]|uniref:Uncharacterized protein n=1 Tax=Mycolicibacterium vanbaalenii TaxID=110539 RepID=A0A5S9NNW9_MYCVN|nr:Uncharacterised protein [Mycolicibacterium vanbaalenii]CAA0133943.1 Uncharacterised protein [Mycolicibacterium vanbaalenii]